ncbi:MAG: EamA family transporter [Verrucomicrobiota bacterium]
MNVKSKNLWLVYALITTLTWGVWGAFSEIPKNNGFPPTLTYVVWSFTMLLPAIIVLSGIDWKIEHDPKSIMMGLAIGLLGAGGQLALFIGALNQGPAYLVFPIISLSPVVTVILSLVFLKEKASGRGWAGIILALLAIPLFAYEPANSPSHGIMWLVYAILIFLAWGVQAYFMKLANNTMSTESIFFYMTLSGLMLAPLALRFTNFSVPVDTGFKGSYPAFLMSLGFKGPYLAFLVQMLNSVGALFIVYAFRYGKAIIVSPLTNAVAPVITVVLSLIILQQHPNLIKVAGMVLAIISIFLMAVEGEKPPTEKSEV